MVESRKVFLLVAVLALVAGVANAQIPSLLCSVNAGSTPPVRAEGVAEEVGQVIITCSGGSPVAAGAAIPGVNVQIFLNTTVTSRLLAASSLKSEALLLIDDPRPVTAGVNPEEQFVADYPFTGVVLGIGDGSYNNGNPNHPTIFHATQVLNAATGSLKASNSLIWTNIPFDAPGTAKVRTLRLVNVRADASNLGVAPLLPNAISMFISISGTATLALTNPQNTVAVVQKGMTFSATGTTFNQCQAPNPNYFTIKFQELFPTAFRIRRTVGASQNVPNTIYNTESMFYRDEVGNNFGGAGLATQGTQLIARFSNVPSDVSLSVDITNGAGNPEVVSLVASGVSGSTTDAATGKVTLDSSRTGAAVWEVTSASTGQTAAVTLNVYVSYGTNPLPGLGKATVAGNYAPTTTINFASDTAPAPRFLESSTAQPTFEILSCQTNLLFPFVTNASGFDTGIVIANTSKDPFGTATQQGPCTVYYYTSGTPVDKQVSTTIKGGEQLVFTASGGNASQGILPTPGFQGYVIVTCNFQYAHGFAFVSDLGATRVAEGYLALVLDKDMYNAGTTRTKVSSETLKQ